MSIPSARSYDAVQPSTLTTSTALAGSRFHLNDTWAWPPKADVAEPVLRLLFLRSQRHGGLLALEAPMWPGGPC